MFLGLVHLQRQLSEYTTLFRSLADTLPFSWRPPMTIQTPSVRWSVPSCQVRAGGRDALKRTMVRDRKSTRLNSSHLGISYAVFCLKKKTHTRRPYTSSPLMPAMSWSMALGEHS